MRSSDVPGGSRHARRSIGCILTALVLLAIGVRSAPTATSATVARVGNLTVTATSLHPGRSDTFTGELHVSTSGPLSDELDAALVHGDTAVGLYHQRVSVGEIPDLASCDGEPPPPRVVDRWLHYGPLLIPGRSSAPAPPATATLSVPTAAWLPTQRTVAVTLYFAHAGPLTVDVPVHSG